MALTQDKLKQMEIDAGINIDQMESDLGTKKKDIGKITTTAGSIIGSLLGSPGGLLTSAAGAGIGAQTGRRIGTIAEEGLKSQDVGDIASMLAKTSPVLSPVSQLIETGAEKASSLLGVEDQDKKLRQEQINKELVDAGKSAAADFIAGSAAKYVVQPVLKGAGALGRGIIRSFIPKNAPVEAVAGVFRLPARAAQRLNPIKVSEKIVKYGLEGDFDDLLKTSDEAIGLFDRVVRDSAANINETIDTSKAFEALKFARQEATNVDEKIINKVSRNITNILSKNQAGVGKLNPIDALDATRELEKRGYAILQSINEANPNKFALEQQANMYLSAADEISSILDKKTGGNGVLELFKSKEFLDQVSNISDELTNDFKKVKTLSDARSLMAPFVRLKQMIDITQASQFSGFAKDIGVKKSILRGFQRPEAALPISKSIQQVSQSPIGKAIGATTKGINYVGKSAVDNLDTLSRVLTQLGLMNTR